MTVVLQLVTGGTPDNPPRVPTSTLDLAELSGGRIFLPWDGPSPGGAGKRELLTAGRGWGRDGERRIWSRRGNAEFSLLMNLKGNSFSDLETIRGEIVSFLERAGLYEEDEIGKPVWLRHRWSPPALRNKDEPRVGQWSRYWRVLDGRVPEWGKSAHDRGLLGGGFVLPQVAIDLTCAPTAMGHRQQAYSVSGVPYVDSNLRLKLSLDFSMNENGTGVWSCGGWLTHEPANYTVFQIWYDASNWVEVRWDNSDGRFEVDLRTGGSTTTYNGSAQSFTAGDIMHVLLSGSGSGLTLYIDGAAKTSGVPAYGPGGGWILYLGRDAAGARTGYVNGLDAWRLWTRTFSAAEALALYTDEAPVKSQLKNIGPPMYNKTAADGRLRNVDGTIGGTDYNNWLVCGSVPGDVPAPATVKITNDLGLDFGFGATWGLTLGVKAVASAFTPSNQHYGDYGGVTDTGTSSNDGYFSTGTQSGNWRAQYDLTDKSRIELMKGRWSVFGRGRLLTAPVKVRAFYNFGTSGITENYSHELSLSPTSNFALIYFGDLVINWVGDTPGRLIWGVDFLHQGANYAVYFDWWMALANPLQAVFPDNTTFSNNHYIEFQDRVATQKTSADHVVQTAPVVGRELQLTPGFYNYCWVLAGAPGVDSPATAWIGWRPDLYVSPQWLLSGGPVAG